MSTISSTSPVDWLALPTPPCQLIPYLGRNISFDSTSDDLADADIAGVGVIVSFLATAYGVFIWMLVAYLCGWLPDHLLGRADRLLYKRSSISGKVHPWWYKAVNISVIAYADQQIATGIAILVAGFAKMSTMSAYHLHVVIYLAWMSSNTHLSAVSLLQAEFRDPNRPIWRALRIVGMSAIGIMLLVILLPTTSKTWTHLINSGNSDVAGVPARCFWHHKYPGRVSGDALWPFVILVASLVWKGMLLFETTQRFVKNHLKQVCLGTISAWLDRIIGWNRPRHRSLNMPSLAYTAMLNLAFRLTMALYVAVWLIFELSHSFAISLWMCLIGLAWGSTHILMHRAYIAANILQEENQWGFGQILPVVLLGLPFLACLEAFSDEHSESRGETPDVENKDNAKHSQKSRQLSGEYSNLATNGTENIGRDSRPDLALYNTRVANENPDIHDVGNAYYALPASQTSVQEDTEESWGRIDTDVRVWRQDERLYKSRFICSSLLAIHLFVFIIVGVFFFMYFYMPPRSSVPLNNGIVGKEMYWGGSALLVWLLIGMAFSHLFQPNTLPKHGIASGLRAPLMSSLTPTLSQR